MRVRTVTVKDYSAVANPTSLDLDSRQEVVFFDNQIVAVILTEWKGHAIAREDEFAREQDLRQIADTLGVTQKRYALMRRFKK